MHQSTSTCLSLCCFWTPSSSALSALICISVSHNMTKRPTHPTWQNACISNYLSAGLARVFVWLPRGFSVYLHIWLAVSCLLTAYVLVFSTCLPCNHASLCVFPPQFHVFSAYISTSLSACLFGSVSSHPPRLTPDNATRAGNKGLQQSSVKVIETWLTGQAAYSFGEINAAEAQWQLLPTHSHSFAKKAAEDTLDCIRMSIYCIPFQKTKNKPRLKPCERFTTVLNIFSKSPEHAMKVTMSHFVCSLCVRSE